MTLLLSLLYLFPVLLVRAKSDGAVEEKTHSGGEQKRVKKSARE